MAQPLPAYKGDRPYVFVSYSHADEEVVFEEIRWLQEQGLNVWYDTTGIGPSSEWSDEIAKAIKGADPFVYFVTPQSVASEHCRREVTFAQSENRRVVVVHLKDTELPDGLRLALENRQAILKHRLARLDYRISLLQSLAPGAHADSTIDRRTGEYQAQRLGKKLASLYPAAFTLAGLVAGSLLMGLLVIRSSETGTEPTRQIRFVASAQPSPEPSPAGVAYPMMALTRDATRLVYAGGGDGKYELYVRSLGALRSRRLEGTEGAQQPFLSPDDNWVGFYDPTTHALKKVSILGGTVARISNAPGALGGATWGPDDTIVFSMIGYPGLYRVSAAGGEYEVLTLPNRERGEFNHHWPHFLPGGQAVAFSIFRRSGLRSAESAVLSLETGQWKTVLPEGRHTRYVDPGFLVYSIGDSLRAVPFDLDRLEATATPIPVEDQTMRAAAQAGNFALSEDGTLAYFSGEAGGQTSLSWINRDGQIDPIPTSSRFYLYPRISPDGTRAAFDLRHDDDDIWIWDFRRQELRQLTFNPGRDRYPVWSADNAWVMFSSSRDGPISIYRKRADGTGEPQKISDQPGSPISASTDGRYLIYRTTSPEGTDLHLLHLDEGFRHEGLLTSESNELNAEISPNGRWLAYQDDQSGEPEIFVRPFPDLEGGIWKISVDGGTQPVWSASGDEIFFVRRTSMMSARVRTESGFQHEQPRHVFTAPNVELRGIGRIFDVARDGQRFLANVVDSDEEESANQVVIVTNWLGELGRSDGRSRTR